MAVRVTNGQLLTPNWSRPGLTVLAGHEESSQSHIGAFEPHDCWAGKTPFAPFGLKPSPVHNPGLKRSCWVSLPPGRGKIDTMYGVHPLGWTGMRLFNWPSAGRVPLQS